MNSIRISQKTTGISDSEQPTEITFAMLPVAQLLLPEGLFVSDQSSAPLPFAELIPILVAPSGEQTYRIIDGCKRFLQLRDRHQDTCACTVLAHERDPITAGLLRIVLNRNRPLEFREKLLFLKWLNNNLKKDDYIQQADHLGIPAHERHSIEELFEANSRIIGSIEKGNLDMAVAPDLCRIKKEDLEAVLSLLCTFSFSRQTQRELLEWLPEIGYRDHCSVESIIEKIATPIVNEIRLNTPQKIQKIRDQVYECKFPTFSNVLQSWKKSVSHINPDRSHVHFEPCTGFEKSRVEIRMTITSPEMAQTIFKKLSDVSAPEWEKVLCPDAGQEFKNAE